MFSTPQKRLVGIDCKELVQSLVGRRKHSFPTEEKDDDHVLEISVHSETSSLFQDSDSEKEASSKSAWCRDNNVARSSEGKRQPSSNSCQNADLLTLHKTGVDSKFGCSKVNGNSSA